MCAANGTFTLATFVSETVSDSDIRLPCDYTWLGPLGQCDTDISIYVAPSKVAKGSKMVTVACRCCWHFLAKFTNVNTA
jgi:hypothetical protein